MASDTTEAARQAQLAVWRRLGPEGRGRLTAEMSEDARRIAIAGERLRHPELSEAEARIRVLQRGWDAELARRPR